MRWCQRLSRAYYIIIKQKQKKWQQKSIIIECKKKGYIYSEIAATAVKQWAQEIRLQRRVIYECALWYITFLSGR